MGIIELYIIFSVATAICAIYELIIPVYNKLKLNKSPKSPTYNSILSYTACFIVFLITAPIAIIPCIVPHLGERFRTALYNNLNQGLKI